MAPKRPIESLTLAPPTKFQKTGGLSFGGALSSKVVSASKPEVPKNVSEYKTRLTTQSKELYVTEREFPCLQCHSFISHHRVIATC